MSRQTTSATSHPERELSRSDIPALNHDKEAAELKGSLFMLREGVVHVIPLYRGDGRVPESIFPVGFDSRGNNPDLLAHAHPGARESGYISTSRSKTISFGYARNNSHGTHSYIYVLNQQKTGIDVCKELKAEVKSGRVDSKVCDLIRTEKEIAIPKKIAAEDVKGVWVLEKSPDGQWQKESFVANPNYKAPLQKAVNALRTVSRGVTAVGIAIDSINLCYAFQECHESGDYRRVFSEGASVIGGWTSAITLGGAAAQAGAFLFAPFGPIASLAGGAIFGVVGSALGYYFGSELVSQICQFYENLQQRNLMTALKQADYATHLYTKMTVPLPSIVPTIYSYEAEETVCVKIDAYFDDIIRNYSDSTKQLLCDMYYNNKNVKSLVNTIENGSAANWRIRYKNKNRLVFEMTIDQKLRLCPIQFRLRKIHEIAVHIGQAHQIIEQVGLDTFISGLSTFQKFTERSVAFPEKILFDSLPKNITDRDILKIPQSLTRRIMANEVAFRKAMSISDYLHLKHRASDDKLTQSDHELFLNNQNITQFLDNEIQRFYSSNEIETLRRNHTAQSKAVVLTDKEIKIKTKTIDACKDVIKKFTDAEIAKFPRFKDRVPEIPCCQCALVEPKSLINKLQSGDTRDYVYVITDDGRVKISDNTNMKIFHRDLVGKNFTVLAAGEIKTKDGVCVINNQSGSYAPSGPHLKDYVLSKFLPYFGSSADKVQFDYFQGYDEKEVAIIAPKIKKKESEAAKAALAERRELERKIEAKKAELAKAQLEATAAIAASKAATAVAKEKNEKLIKSQAAAQHAYSDFEEKMRLLTKAHQIANEARKKADSALKAGGLLTANGLLKSTLVPTQLTNASSFSEAFTAIKNVMKNPELKKNENWPKYSKELQAFDAYIFSKVGRRLPCLRFIIEAHPSVSTADEFYGLAKQYLKGDATEKHFSLDCLYMASELNPNHHNALCLIGALLFSNFFGTQNTQYADAIEYLKRAREKGNATAAEILKAIPSGSTTPDNDGEGQRAAVAQGAAYARIANSIRNAINNGQFDLRGDSYSHGARGSSNQGNDDHDHLGERAGNWGARGGSDMWGGGSGESRGKNSAGHNSNGRGSIGNGSNQNGNSFFTRSDSAGDHYTRYEHCGGGEYTLSGTGNDANRVYSNSEGAIEKCHLSWHGDDRLGYTCVDQSGDQRNVTVNEREYRESSVGHSGWDSDKGCFSTPDPWGK
ncbi:MAG: hypothetical protein Q8L78_06880 [Coxiellaceae bacterium]|nr:hypothetical protein [Coxiellaceae bacterium]